MEGDGDRVKIQSLSIVVPGGCPNNCMFCVSKLHENPYVNQIEQNKSFRDLYKRDFQKRMMFARDNGCNTVMLTGNGEPLMNESFLNFFSEWNEKLDTPFRWIEIQTSGVTLNEAKLRWLRNEIGVNVISLSLSDVFDSENNLRINRTPKALHFNIMELCRLIKKYDFVLRLSLNLTDAYNLRTPAEILGRCEDLGADQVTFRVLYEATEDNTINEWIRQHRCRARLVNDISEHVQHIGRELEKLPFGASRYSIEGMSIVVDDDCMSGEVKEDVKYLILQPNCKLYTKWDDRGSLLF